MAAAACFAAGLMSYELISFHFSSTRTVTGPWIPIFVAVATAGGIAASLVLGRLYDRVGWPSVVGAILVSSAFAPFVFLGDFATALIGMLPWGIGYATQDTLFKAVVASLLPTGKRSVAFGLFYAGYGVGWLVGSVVAGFLYDRSRMALVLFSIGMQLIAVPVLVIAARAEPRLRATRGRT